MKDKIYFLLPNFLQSLLISLFNFFAYKKRYGGKYKYYLTLFKQNRGLSFADLVELQKNRYSKFMQQAVNGSAFYKALYASIPEWDDLGNITSLPIVNKELFRKDINAVYTINKKEGIVSKTGGTTGKSLEVLFTNEDMQERFAMLDDFRGRFGYKLGEKTAWFSGKNLLSKRDISKSRFWKMDYVYNVKYYSTFHVKESYLKHYLADLIKFKPKYLVGFPSTILEIAKYGIKHNINFPDNIIKAVFPTAETVTPETRQLIEQFFKTSVYDQYASSEGAPFIFECYKGKLHLEMQSGIFEVLDEHNNNTKSGRLIVTSFTTSGTPLIRYDIGDDIEIIDDRCDCGNNNPLVKQILGRIDDYVFSPEIGKINLGNVSNTLKDTKGIIKFQVIQNELNRILIKIVVDLGVFNKQYEEVFLNNWIARVGKKMTIEIERVDDIPVEKSGKYRIVKNTVKNLVDQLSNQAS